MDEIHLPHLRRAIAVARRARENGNHPFGAILVDKVEVIGPLLEDEVRVVHEGFWR